MAAKRRVIDFKMVKRLSTCADPEKAAVYLLKNKDALQYTLDEADLAPVNFQYLIKTFCLCCDFSEIHVIFTEITFLDQKGPIARYLSVLDSEALGNEEIKCLENISRICTAICINNTSHPVLMKLDQILRKIMQYIAGKNLDIVESSLKTSIELVHNSNITKVNKPVYNKSKETEKSPIKTYPYASIFRKGKTDVKQDIWKPVSESKPKSYNLNNEEWPKWNENNVATETSCRKALGAVAWSPPTVTAPSGPTVKQESTQIENVTKSHSLQKFAACKDPQQALNTSAAFGLPNLDGSASVIKRKEKPVEVPLSSLLKNLKLVEENKFSPISGKGEVLPHHYRRGKYHQSRFDTKKFNAEATCRELPVSTIMDTPQTRTIIPSTKYVTFSNSKDCSQDMFIKAAKEQLTGSQTDLLQFLNTKKGQLQYKLKGSDTTRTETQIIIQVLAKAFSSTGQGNQIPVMSIVGDTDWILVGLRKYIRNLDWINIDSKERQMIENMISVCKALVTRIPRLTAYQISLFLVDLKQRLQSCTFFTEVTAITKKVEKILEIADLLVEECLENKQEPEIVNQKKPSINFLETEISPQKNDIEEQFEVPINIIRGRYQNVNLYLDTQFRLLREDFIAPLRSGIREYLQEVKLGKPSQRLTDAFIYNNVKFVGIKDGFILQFDVARFSINWERTKRLLPGSLVCLSSDYFKTFVTGSVAYHNVKMLEDGQVEILFESHDIEKLSFNKYYTMIESTSYFEAYKHVLVKLKEFGHNAMSKNEPIPFQEYIVDVSRKGKCPPYINEMSKDIKIDVSSLLRQSTMTLKDFLEGNWTLNVDELMDQSQLQALFSALTREFAIIQGPPGTGKSFIGLKIIAFLLANRLLWKRNINDRIMIVTYTNHALDQFLEEILKLNSETRLVRIGGRCSPDSTVYEHTLSSIRARRRPRRKGDSDGEDDDVIIIDLYQESTELKNMRREKRNITSLNNQLKTEIFDGPFGKTLMTQLPHILGYDVLSSLFIYSVPVSQCLAYWLLNVDPYEACDYSELDLLKKLVNSKNSSKIDGADSSITEGTADLEMKNIRDMADLELQQREVEDTDNEWIMVKRKKTIKIMNEEMENTLTLRKKLFDILTEKARKLEPMDDDGAESVTNIWNVHSDNRIPLYLAWVKRFREMRFKQFQSVEEMRKKCTESIDRMKRLNDLEIVCEAEIVGLTTTGASKYASLLKNISPRITIVEEAAEILEAHQVASLTPSCQQLILIGDHRQLRPNPNVYNLAKDHNMDISFFERMIRNNYPIATLTRQHRMREEISSILVPHFYKTLANNENVKYYPDVKGIQGNFFFVDHNYPENPPNENRSYSNDHEASLIAYIARYLIQQGYDCSQITILTPYTGQMYKIKEKLQHIIKIHGTTELQNIKVTPIDNYQGEENDIVLVSFVRSNKDGNIGFLKTSNRVCVALSRAKWGMYCIGNFKSYTYSPLWCDLLQYMKKQKILISGLPLVCQKHKDKQTFVTTTDDFLNVPHGGCDKKCDFRYPECGHQCNRFCHNYDHIMNICQMQCVKLCPRGHPCPDICGNPCDVCYDPCGLSLACGHLCITFCGEKEFRIIEYKNLDMSLSCNHVCLTKVERLLHCGHKTLVQCSEDLADVSCKAVVLNVLKCGHEKQMECGTSLTGVTCHETVTESLKLSCGHTGPAMTCHQKSSGIVLEDTVVCKYPCKKKLLCGHVCSGTCTTCSNGLHVRCGKPCKRILICGHYCTGKCSDLCAPCRKNCEIHCWHRNCTKVCSEGLCKPCQGQCKWQCEHYKCTKMCHEKCDRRICDRPCTKLLPCGHSCLGVCGEPCPLVCYECHMTMTDEKERKENRLFIRVNPCGHVIDLQKMDEYMYVKRINNQLKIIEVKRCLFPNCNRPIVFCPRYSEEIKDSLKLMKEIAEHRATFKGAVDSIKCKENVLLINKMIDTLHEGKPGDALSIILRIDSLNTRIVDHFKNGYLDKTWLQCRKGHQFMVDYEGKNDPECPHCKKSRSFSKKTTPGLNSDQFVSDNLSEIEDENDENLTSPSHSSSGDEEDAVM